MRARLHINFDHLEVNFVPIEDEMRVYICSSLVVSTGIEMSSIVARASDSARLKAEMMTTGWMLRSS